MNKFVVLKQSVTNGLDLEIRVNLSAISRGTIIDVIISK